MFRGQSIRVRYESFTSTVAGGTVEPLTAARFFVGSSRPKWRTALLARELACCKVDIVTLSESQFSQQGQVEELGDGYAFFWSGRPQAERYDASIAFAIRTDIVGCLPCLPQGINDRLMSLRLPLCGDKFTSIIIAYAPSLNDEL
ncbi:unnamed protein product [Schistocephalus solidus]|uniref:Uncharacterized protein n=1 Tax=Schistocephalus solidus TaxID=70667 RepID=A0A183SH25_SCHSO|nr:unnamed protein product [Schistocephalus solidus]